MAKLSFMDYVTTTDTIWTVKQLCEYAEQGMVSFDNAVQRDYVWDIRKNSLLIHSVIVNFMPPEFLANKKGNIYDMIDGKQRHNALSKFLEDKYRLVDVPALYSIDGVSYEINGKLFRDLEPEIQEKITGRGLKISVMDNASQDVIKEYFYRRNNGVQLTASRKTFSQAASFDTIAEMAKHPIFKAMFSKEGNDDSTGIVMKSYVLLNCEVKSLENKKVFSYMKRAIFSEEQSDIIRKSYDTILAAYNLILESGAKDARKIAKIIMKKTHMMALVPIAKYANENNISQTVFAKWVSHFFAGSSLAGATISELYNENTSTGTAKEPAVKARMEAMIHDFKDFSNRLEAV